MINRETPACRELSRNAARGASHEAVSSARLTPKGRKRWFCTRGQALASALARWASASRQHPSRSARARLSESRLDRPCRPRRLIRSMSVAAGERVCEAGQSALTALRPRSHHGRALAPLRQGGAPGLAALPAGAICLTVRTLKAVTLNRFESVA